MLRKTIALAALAALAACAPQPGRTQAQQTLDNIRTGYLAANLAVVGYSALRACGEGVAAPCSDLNLVAQFRTALGAASVAIAVADGLVSKPDSTPITVNQALIAATEAVAGAVKLIQAYQR